MAANCEAAPRTSRKARRERAPSSSRKRGAWGLLAASWGASVEMGVSSRVLDLPQLLAQFCCAKWCQSLRTSQPRGIGLGFIPGLCWCARWGMVPVGTGPSLPDFPPCAAQRQNQSGAPDTCPAKAKLSSPCFSPARHHLAASEDSFCSSSPGKVSPSMPQT